MKIFIFFSPCPFGIFRVLCTRLGASVLLFGIYLLSLTSCTEGTTRKNAKTYDSVNACYFIDYESWEDSLKWNVIFEIDSIGLAAISDQPTGVGTVYLQSHSDTINSVFELRYGSRRAFELIPIRLPDCLNQPGYKNYKIDWGIPKNYDTDMMSSVFTGYLEKEWTISFYEIPNVTFTKKKGFALKRFSYCDRLEMRAR